MSTSFKNAPLVELIAELRWTNPGLSQAQSPQNNAAIQVQIGAGDNRLEEFFMAFAAEISQYGFPRAERLVPAGFPSMSFQPVYRFRKNAEPTSPILYQVGAGLFSANAIPPYKSWEEFSPRVREGVTTLLKVRSAEEQSIPFSTLTLRYVDAFRPPLTKNLDVGSFLEDVLKIKIEVPEAISKNLSEGASIKPFLQLNVPMDGSNFGITVAEGFINNEPAIVMDMNVSSIGLINPDVDEVMAKFHAARDRIHYTFVELTKSLQDLMEPIKD
jgi:uncharacterized protein (TIGR04255 family)